MRSQILTVAVLAALLPVPVLATEICNPSPITINASGTATPYPAAITVAGAPPGIPRLVAVTIKNFSHTFSRDVGMVLIAPSSQTLAIQDGAGDASLSNVTYTIADSGAAQLPATGAWTAGTFKPTAYFNNNFPSPGPGIGAGNPGPFGGGVATFANSFVGQPANGAWNLVVSDFAAGNSGTIAGGWCLTLVMTQKGDLNLDGGADLLLQQASNPGHHEAWFMDGTARLGSQVALTPDAAAGQQLRGSDQFVASSAGTNDLVWWNSTTGAVEFWSMNGVSRSGAAIPLTGASPLPLNWQIAATGDFNGDQKPDLLWRNESSQNLVIWTLNGTAKTGNIVPNPSQAVNSNWRVVAALDYNADGNRDLLWYNDTSGKIVVWYMDGSVVRISGAFTNPDSAGNSNWKVVAGGDYGPGTGGPAFANDIVWRNETSGKLVVWQMDHAGNRVSGQFTTPDAPAPALDWNVVGPK